MQGLRNSATAAFMASILWTKSLKKFKQYCLFYESSKIFLCIYKAVSIFCNLDHKPIDRHHYCAQCTNLCLDNFNFQQEHLQTSYCHVASKLELPLVNEWMNECNSEHNKITMQFFPFPLQIISQIKILGDFQCKCSLKSHIFKNLLNKF